MAEAAALEAFGRLFLPKVTFGTFLAGVLHAFGTNPDGVCLFRMNGPRCPSEADFCFLLRVSKVLFGSPSADELDCAWACILMVVVCFACMPHGAPGRPTVAFAFF